MYIYIYRERSSDFFLKLSSVFVCQISCLVSESRAAPIGQPVSGSGPVFRTFLGLFFWYNMCATTESRGVINGDTLISKEGGCNEDAMRERSEGRFVSGFLRRQLPLCGLLRTLPLREVTLSIFISLTHTTHTLGSQNIMHGL